ncbi:MAG: EamA family transporter [Verrucomicrobiales bacterium]
MKPWVTYAILSMLFAGFTSVVAKMGLAGITGEVGLTVRTVFVAVLVIVFAVFAVSPGQLSALTRDNFVWLGVSGLTTTLSWIFYYKALKDGEVSTIAVIDKASMVVAVLLAFFILKEKITPRTMAGGALMIAGLLVIARK